MKLRINNSVSIVISLFFLAVSFLSQAADIAPIKVAVASNFKNSLTEIAANYALQSGQKIIISSASTGTLYNQIRHGAPFDLFLSADKKRAQLIEQSGLGVKGSRFTYAQGQLAFWAPKEAKVDLTTLKQYSGRFAIANPRLAPYGLAAEQALKALHLWRRFSYVQGTNISQTYQFIESGNVEAGLVAYAQLLQNQQLKAEQYYLLPAQLHQAIVQQGVLLAATKQPEKVQQFIDYLLSDETQALLSEKGYL